MRRCATREGRGVSGKKRKNEPPEVQDYTSGKGVRRPDGVQAPLKLLLLLELLELNSSARPEGIEIAPAFPDSRRDILHPTQPNAATPVCRTRPDSSKVAEVV